MTREEFLASASALAALGPAAGATPVPLPRGFSIAAFAAALAAPAKHKPLFAAITEAQAALGGVRNTLNAYAETGVSVAAVKPAVVFYHDTAVLWAFDDTIWNKYVIPAKSLTLTAAELKAGGNPLLRHENAGERDASMPELIALTGLHFFVCNLATLGFAERLAKALSLDKEAVYADMAVHVVPNGMLVPAGVWAVHAIQEHGYTLLQYA